MRARFIGIALATLVLIAPAYGDAIFTLGNHPQPNEQNILFNNPVTGTTIDGVTNQSDTTVQFSSSTDVLMASGGQAKVTAQDGLVNDIAITVPGHTFMDLIFNPFQPQANNDLVVMVVTNTGTFMKTYGAKNGQNFLTITTTGGEVIDSVTIDSASGFHDLRQVRISGISGIVVIPEPSSVLLLLGSGLAGLAGIVRRKLTR